METEIIIDDLLDNLKSEKSKVLVAACKEKLHDELTIGVFGEIAAGKSTFINALCGKKLLPQGLGETTKVMTIISKDEEEKTTKTSDEISTYFEEKKASEIECIEISHNNIWTEKNIKIIDTPGLGSGNEQHTEIVQKAALYCDFFVFVIKIDSKISDASGLKSFYSYLKDKNIVLNNDNTLFVLNKIDRCNTNIGRENQILKKQIEEILEIKDAVLIEVSSESALLSRTLKSEKNKADLIDLRHLNINKNEIKCDYCMEKKSFFKRIFAELSCFFKHLKDRKQPCLKKCEKNSNFENAETAIEKMTKDRNVKIEKIRQALLKILEEEKSIVSEMSNLSEFDKYFFEAEKVLKEKSDQILEHRLSITAKSFLELLWRQQAVFTRDSVLLAKASNDFDWGKEWKIFCEEIDLQNKKELKKIALTAESQCVKEFFEQAILKTDLLFAWNENEVSGTYLNHFWTLSTEKEFIENHIKQIVDKLKVKADTERERIFNELDNLADNFKKKKELELKQYAKYLDGCNDRLINA